MKLTTLVFILMISLGATAKEIKVPKMLYNPVFKDPGETAVFVGPLWVDETPVTNQEFADFIKNNPEFSRARMTSLLADRNYLAHWKSQNTFSKAEARFPVTNVSWFAASKYCATLGKRLPTIAEWEVFSDAQNPKLETLILEWYANPNTKLRSVGGPANKLGIKDAHGLIWEWVDNFSEAIMSGDSRGGSSTDSLFCGGAGLRAKDPTLYATFMRFAFRSSLTGRYVSGNLGFRCVTENLRGSK